MMLLLPRDLCTSLLLCVLLLSACKTTSDHQRAQPPTDAPVLGTGKLPEPQDPLSALRRRANVIVPKDDLLYVGSSAGVQVWRVSGEDQLTEVAHLTLPGNVLGLALMDKTNRLAVALGPNGVLLLL